MTVKPSSLQSFDQDTYVVASFWLKDMLYLCLGNGNIVLFNGPDQVDVLGAHQDASLLCAFSDGEHILTGGDDGRVVLLSSDSALSQVAHEKGRWIDAVTLSQKGIAWSAGKKVSLRDEKGRVHTIDAPSTALGLAFAPKGLRLAFTHYNGVSLWYPGTSAQPEVLSWKGSHIDVVFSDNGRFVVSSMQENALHGWILQSPPGHMRMTGYPAKTRSMSWSSDHKWLATSGAEAIIIWPFTSKDGPMGQAPRECGVAAFARGARCVSSTKHDGCGRL